MQKPSVTVVVIAKNEERMLPGCLNTLEWCQERIVLESGSTDSTVAVAKKLGARVVTMTDPSFAKRRTEVLKNVSTKWVLYVDPDERVTPALARSITEMISNTTADVGLIARKNFHYGHAMNHGGWLEPALPRLFVKQVLSRWEGDIHESPVYTGTSRRLEGELWHFTHRSVADGLYKTAAWTPMEARLLYESGVSAVTPWTVARKGLGEIFRRGFTQQGYKDGATGWVEVFTQSINRMLVYLQVWELQQNPPIQDRYISLEKELADQWKNE